MKTASKVLHLLEQKTTHLSGQEIANRLGLSRTAVWKAIKSLQDAGYTIESQPHNGYLLKDSQLLSATFIKRKLSPTIKLEFEINDSLSSTNTRAKECGARPLTNLPQIILSDRQTSGYGRYGREFDSPQGTGIYLSLLLQNHQENFDAGLLTTATATALCRALVDKLEITPGIKWVNDVLWQDKKICGILTEGITDLETGDLKQIVVGVGINFLTPTKVFSPDLQKRAGSLKKVVQQKKLTRNAMIAAFLNEFFKLYPSFTSTDFISDYRKYCTTLGKRVTITQGRQQFTGLAQDITSDGALILNDGRVFSSGEITKIRTAAPPTEN